MWFCVCVFVINIYCGVTWSFYIYFRVWRQRSLRGSILQGIHHLCIFFFIIACICKEISICTNCKWLDYQCHSDIISYISPWQMDNALIDDRRIHVDFSQSVSKLWNQFRSNGKHGGTGKYRRLSDSQYLLYWGVL